MVAGKDDYSSNEEDEDDFQGHKFQRHREDRADTMKMFLESK